MSINYKIFQHFATNEMRVNLHHRGGYLFKNNPQLFANSFTSKINCKKEFSLPKTRNFWNEFQNFAAMIYKVHVFLCSPMSFYFILPYNTKLWNI